MSISPTVLILAPYWGNPRHVGVYRVDRFVRWLASAGVGVILVRAGTSDRERSTAWGCEITIRDPLNLFGDVNEEGDFAGSKRRPNRLRRWMAEWLLNPDPAIVWVRRVVDHALVVQKAGLVTHIMASSPPESVQVGASLLAKKMGKPLIVDMRDGWLDEPLKPLLQRSQLRRWQEGRLEFRVLNRASFVFVTSEVWKELLLARFPEIRGKITVLPNAYPDESLLMPRRAQQSPGTLRLLHAGRFSGSSNNRLPRHLLRPLLQGVAGTTVKGSLLFLGSLEEKDLNDLAQFSESLETCQWTIETEKHVPRERMIEIMGDMDGLLLLSTSHAAIPSKFFEYLATGKPVFASTPYQSAVWRIGEALPQVFLADYQTDDCARASRAFIEACLREDAPGEIPSEFSEPVLSKVFLNTLQIG